MMNYNVSGTFVKGFFLLIPILSHLTPDPSPQSGEGSKAKVIVDYDTKRLWGEAGERKRN